MVFDSNSHRDNLPLSTSRPDLRAHYKSVRLNVMPRSKPATHYADEEIFRIVLICGAERTGTTLIQRILCSDPTTIPIVGEIPIINNIVDLVLNARENFDFFYTDYFRDSEELNAIVAATINSIMESMRRKHPGKLVSVLKAPAFTPQLPVLREILPNANFVVMTRNPMDAIASMDQVAKKARATGSAPLIAALAGDIEALTRRFLSYYEPLMSMNAADMSPITFVKYEDLVTQPDAEILRLSANLHLTLSLETDMTEVMQSIYLHERSNAKHQTYWSDLYRLDISPTRVGSYKDCLSSEQQRAVSTMARDYSKWRRRPWTRISAMEKQ